MCGIHGILMFKGRLDNASQTIKKMGAVTSHRGPDDDGEYIGDGIYFGQRRLSIIDLELGHQPISNEDNSIWLICNGEIYNFQETREKLKEKGHRFKTGSDSEVILHLYEEYGDDLVDHLNGMYAFAVWDEKKRRLLIGRDKLGIKPIYYFQDQDKLIFSSEVKSILEVSGVSRDIDYSALNQYLQLGYVPTPLTMFNGIKKLPAATLLTSDEGKLTQRNFWKFQAEPDFSLSEDQWAEKVLECLHECVVSQMVSDVPLGAFLSGGIDSSSIVALMAKQSNIPIKTYSIGFDTGKGSKFYNELPYAKKVAELYATEHREILVRPDVVELLPKLIWHLDEPIADAAFITTYLVAQFARQDVTVILSGVGGDELFGGYRRYLGEYYGNYYNKIPQWMRKSILAPLANKLPADRHSALLNLSRYARSFILSNELSFEERYRNYVQVFNKDVISQLLKRSQMHDYDALAQAFHASAKAQGVDRLFQVDLLTQLPDDLLMLTDKMTMATSLECRVPLLDDRLVDLAMRMPSHYKIKGKMLKSILKKALKGTLPDEILHRKKRGFGAPMGAWLKEELAPLMKTILSKQSIERRGVFDWRVVDETIKAHESNKEDHTDHLQSLMNFEIWAKMYLDGTSANDLTDELRRELV